MKKGILIAIFALFVSVTSTFAQAFFSTEKNAFYDQLAAYLNTSTSKQERDKAAKMMEAFRGVWDSYYYDQEAGTVMRLCELLHAKSGGRAYANIFNFVEVVQRIPTAGLTHTDVNNWLCYTDAKAQKSMNGVDKYLVSCRNLFVDKVLSAKGNSKWELRDALLGFPSKEQFELTVDGTLALVSQKDESLLKNTKGVFYLESNNWKGMGGTADWTRFKIPADQVFVTLPDYYELDLSRSEYAIDSVIFHEHAHFNQDILCRYEDKVLVNAPNEKTMYPRVKSYRSDYAIRDLMRNVDFEGGIGMMGNQVDVFGGVNNKAVFHFRQGGREIVRAQAQRFVMSMDELLVTDRAALRLYLLDTVGLEMDSIYHNGLGFRYDNKTRKMMVYRSEKDFGDGPFHDYYHGLDIFLEAMYWNIDDNQVDFRRMEGVNPVSEGDVVSVNYFRHNDFKKLQGLDGSHPMIRIEKFLQGFDNVERQVKFAVGDLATYLDYPIEQVISLMLRLQAEGYVEYDTETKWATALPRFFDVVDSYREAIDYDNIKLHTVTTNRQPNVRLDLNTNDLLVYGIKSQIDGYDGSAIALSDRKRVVIVPDFGRVTFTKHQNFTFSGGILAGMFEFFTKDSEFKYDDFTIKMEKVDSVRFYARYDNHIIPVDGTLEKLKGRLDIDHGDNKSSRYATPEYPIFYSDAEGFKFYRKINGGVFHPGSVDSVMTAEDLEGKFYYSLYPFVIDSLNDLSMKNVRFDGELVSGGIMPNIKQPLVVMDDYSLGFSHQIGENEAASYPLYGDLGRFHNKVFLSSSGFFGEGMLDYQTAAFKSDQFVFYLDSVTAITNLFKMTPLADGTRYPVASSSDALRLKWDIQKPELTTETIDKPICMYGDTYFSGKTALTPDGYSADGKLRFGLTEFDSDHFALDATTFVADSADFRLYSSDTANVAFAASNYRANVDFNAQKVKYDYLDQNSNLDFPMNQYICSLKEAEWDMATNNLHLHNPVESFGDYANAITHEELLAIHNDAAKFISLVPEQDSLQFYSMSAEYDMTNYVIHAHDVKIIRVADAAVFPYTHDVDINSESKLEPISGELLADTLNQFHLYKDAVVNIHSRNYYDAYGTWNYTNADGANIPIRMDTIVPVDGITHGYANIEAASEFKLSKQFGFQGRLTLDATEQLGYFDGKFAMLGFENEAPEPVEGNTASALNHWFVSSTHINPASISIPVNMDRIREEEPNMCNGLYYELAIDGGYFGSFLTPKEGRNELDEAEPVGGVLWYNADSLCFVVSDTTQFDARIELNSRGVINGHGTTDLGFDTPLAKFAFHGDYTQYPNYSLTLRGLNVFNAPVFDDKAMAAMAEVFANAVGMSIDLTQTNYVPYFRSENSEQKTEELLKSIELSGGYPKMESSDFYSNTIVIPDLKMVWNDNIHAFISTGKIGLGNFGNHVVNKYVDGCVMFDRRLGNITYYFQNETFQTYINYNVGDGQFQVHCTFGDINQRLSETKERHRTRTKDGKQFQYVAVPYESMLDFLNRLKYAGLSIGSF